MLRYGVCGYDMFRVWIGISQEVCQRDGGKGIARIVGIGLINLHFDRYEWS